MLCPYRNMLGKPGEGIHAYRIFDIAVVDVMWTLLGGFLLSLVFPRVPKLYIITGLFVLGILVHRLFCVRTKIDRLVFG
jgi:hypothetical protein